MEDMQKKVQTLEEANQSLRSQLSTVQGDVASLRGQMNHMLNAVGTTLSLLTNPSGGPTVTALGVHNATVTTSAASAAAAANGGARRVLAMGGGGGAMGGLLGFGVGASTSRIVPPPSSSLFQRTVAYTNTNSTNANTSG
jgi:hypothetical protein